MLDRRSDVYKLGAELEVETVPFMSEQTVHVSRVTSESSALTDCTAPTALQHQHSKQRN